MSDNQSDLAAREVDEALRKERMMALWKANGRYVYAAAILIVLIVAGRELYTSQVVEAQKAQSDIFNTAQRVAFDNPGDLQAPVVAWQTALGELKGDYNSLAKLQLAASQSEAGDIEGAIATYDALARQGSIEETVRDLARLLAAILVADELGDLEDGLSRLALVTGDDRPWKYSAKEQQGFILLALGQVEQARSVFEDLSFDTTTPAGIKQRATSMRDALPTAPLVVED